MGLFEDCNVGFFTFIGLFGLVSLVHLFFCFKMIPKWRKITKPFCLFFLGTAFLFLSPTTYLIWISCYCSMIGDLFLIRNKEAKFFIIGAIVFAIAHTLNAINQVMMLSYSINIFIYVAVGVLILFIGVISFATARGKKSKREIAAVGSSYACFHILNIVLAILLIVDGQWKSSIYVLIGYIIYVVSDFIVNYVTNKHDINRRDLYIMITYLVGQCGIYFGLAMAM